MLNVEVFGKKLESERKKQGLTQEQLAEMADVSMQTISGYERGDKKPNLDTAVRIANTLSLSLDFLCDGSEVAEQRKTDPKIATLADIQAILDILYERIPDCEIQSEDDHIAFFISNCPQIAKYYQSYITMSELLNNGTITPHIFQIWKDGATKSLAETKIEDYQLPF